MRFAASTSILSMLIGWPSHAQTACEDQKLLAPDGSQLDEFGSAVAIWDGIAVVGTHRDDDIGGNAGSIYIFRFDDESSGWVLEQKLVAADGADHDWFGDAVAASEDLVAAAAPYHDAGATDTGAAYVYRPDNGLWVQEQKLTAPDAEAGDVFGWALAIDEGPPERIVVAAPFDDDMGFNAGSVYVFRYEDPDWVFEQKLTADDGAMLDNFGVSVAIGGGPPARILVGAYNHDALGVDSGAVYSFRFEAGTAQWLQEQKLLAGDGGFEDQFGSAVSLSGQTALIASAWDDDNGENAGAAYVFGLDGGAWVQQQKLLAADGQAADFFGFALAVAGQTAAITAPFDDENGTDSGALYVFGSDGGAWVQQQKLVASDGDPNDIIDTLGYAVGLHEMRIAAGAPWDEDAAGFAGAVFMYNLAPGPGDVDCDGVIGITDLLVLLADWGPCADCPADLDGDGVVGILDFLTLLANWGP